MLETELAVATVKIVLDVLDKVTGGALEEVGTQLLQYLKTKLQGTLKLDKVREDPALLRATVLDRALEDKRFKSDLEQLVLKFQKLESNTAKTIQNNQSGVNINAENSNVVGQQFFRNQQ
ncbi:hypothetical protein [Leptolyngbya sp. FACHB-261]|uniref:hypothetical protein n=1 Tax=Leptolyngbya sp. FACHB-261 TaxID=2692806 RepID=UPI0016897493|nr:hypothetical protein [Leptolyngbya sp. FACHB-261]MBD2099303.1 hypothetical protein [Leptolyngbya sp. FACHB-261]